MQYNQPRLHLRHITDFDYEYDEVGDLPGFFPPNMNKNDVELYLSHQKKKTSPIITVNKNDWLSQCVATFKEGDGEISLSRRSNIGEYLDSEGQQYLI